jgi:hypothetical protein
MMWCIYMVMRKLERELCSPSFLQATALILLYVCIVHFKENWHDSHDSPQSAKS